MISQVPDSFPREESTYQQFSEYLTTNIVSVYSLQTQVDFFRNPDINCENLPCFPSQIQQGSGQEGENF